MKRIITLIGSIIGIVFDAIFFTFDAHRTCRFIGFA